MNNSALSALVAGVVDYAGLFPPAKLDMRPAAEAYAAYLDDPHRAMLAAFVVPVARLPEFEEATYDLLPRGEESTPWRLSVLAGPDVGADLQLALKFNCRHWPGSELGHAVIDAMEIKAASVAEIEATMSGMPAAVRPFFELPIDEDPDALIRALARTNGRAKVRTGGVTAEAFPTPEHVARFLMRCAEHRVPFKATAGLHHPIRATYRLTYEPNPPMGVMYGYLNVFIAGLLAWELWPTQGAAAEPLVRRALEETDLNAFIFDTRGLSYQGHTLSVEAVRAARDAFATSFGSCSFREPVDELVGFDLLH